MNTPGGVGKNFGAPNKTRKIEADGKFKKFDIIIYETNEIAYRKTQNCDFYVSTNPISSPAFVLHPSFGVGPPIVQNVLGRVFFTVTTAVTSLSFDGGNYMQIYEIYFDEFVNVFVDLRFWAPSPSGDIDANSIKSYYSKNYLTPLKNPLINERALEKKRFRLNNKKLVVKKR